MERKIFWLASYPKSGNTWVRMFLDVYVTGFPVKFNSAYKYVNIDHDRGMLQLVSAKPVNELTLQEQFMYHPAMIANLLHTAKTKDIVVKTHNARITVSGMPLVPTPLTGGTIYVVRDPRDIAISYASHLGLPIDTVINTMANEEHMATSRETKLFHLMSSWSLHVNSWIRSDFPITIVKYEDLLTDPWGMFTSVLNFLGIVDIDRAAFDFALEQSSFQVLSDMEDAQGYIERSSVSKDKFFRVGKAGQWKSQLTAPQLKKIFEDHGQVMEELGYV